MNSSGIKRGLAATAVAALAVTGIPALASSASAATGDSIAVALVGPVRNGGDQGGVVVLKTKGIDPTDLKVVGSDLTSSPNNANQSVAIVGTPTLVADKDAADSDPTDGLDEITVRIAATTPSAGGSAKFAIFEDEGATPNGAVDAAESRAQVELTTSGAPASLELSPVTQTVPEGVAGKYSVTIKDNAGRVTQLTDAETVDVTAAGTTLSDASIDKTEAPKGVGSFTATSATKGLYPIKVTGPNSTAANGQLDVVAAATGLTSADVDVVTGADTWDGFGGGTNAVTVRADQTAVRFDIKSTANKGATVVLDVAGTGLTFGGKAGTTVTTTLDSNGVGSVTVTPDASSIAAGDSFTVSGGGINITATYANPKVDSIDADGATYVSKFGGSVDVTAKVLDQFGNPVTGTYVTVQRTGGANADAAQSARKAVDASGKVTFTLTDTKATAASHASDTITLRVYAGQLDATPLATDTGSKIVYTADGLGEDFVLTVDGKLPAGSAYDPKAVFANPLTDTVANDLGDSTNETIALGITNGTTGAPITVTADNGAIILKNGATALSKGSASVTGVVGDTFALAGTKAGLVNVTVTSGGRTKTAQVSIHSLSQDAATAAAAPNTARNIAVSGPAKAEANDVVTFNVVVTDAFGNPVANVPAANVNTLVTGPGQVQGTSGKTDANGVLAVQVKIDNDADSSVSLQVKGTGLDFGAAANRQTAASTSDDAQGLAASTDSATATITDVVNIEALEQAVADAQAKVDAAQDRLTEAQGDLSVAKAEVQVAQSAVNDAKKDLKQAKKKNKGVKAARKALKAARGDLKIARASVKAEQQVVNIAKTRLAAAQAELEAAQAELDEAQQD